MNPFDPHHAANLRERYKEAARKRESIAMACAAALFAPVHERDLDASLLQARETALSIEQSALRAYIKYLRESSDRVCRHRQQ